MEQVVDVSYEPKDAESIDKVSSRNLSNSESLEKSENVYEEKVVAQTLAKNLKIESSINIIQDDIEVEYINISVESSRQSIDTLNVEIDREPKQPTTPLPSLLDTLTIDERQVFARFKQIFGSKFSDHTLGRFLRARKFDFEKSKLMFENYIK